MYQQTAIIRCLTFRLPNVKKQGGVYVPFRCKSRFCNTCGATYVAERAKTISYKLINCSHRHLVFTIPAELRSFFQRDRSLLDILFKASSQTLLTWFHNINKSEHFTPGFISTLHTYGRDMKWNPHIHLILTEGATGNQTVWRHIKHIPFTMLRRRWQATLLSLLHEKPGTTFYTLKSKLFYHYKDGFYVYAKNEKQSIIKDSIDYIVRYYGLYAKKHKQASKLFLLVSKQKKKFWKQLSNWRNRLILAFGVDPLRCSCGNTMELLDIFIPKKASLLDYRSPPLYNVS